MTPPAIKIRIEDSQTGQTEYSFITSFIIGRGEQCEIRLNNDLVSRAHAKICFENGKWWVRDKDSVNGTFVNNRRVEKAPLSDNTRIKFAEVGPVLLVSIDEGDQTRVTQVDPLTMTHYKDRYFSDSGKEDIGEHTMMIRRAFRQVHGKQKKKYVYIIAGITFLLVAAGSYAIFKHRQVAKQRHIAEEIFYTMKAMELEFAGILKMAREKKDPDLQQYVEKYHARKSELENKYDQFMVQLNVYREGLSREERLILRIARVFGECEMNMPNDFSKEVRKYIKKWKSTGRLKAAISRAKQNRYNSKIVKTMTDYNLPPQFFYLALQESDFKIKSCGPKTRYGIAKGIWQFIPGTAKHYGLKVGPRAHLRKFDPKDERYHFDRATDAAARYLRFLYDTEAQASGLLVAASYNWGESNIIGLLKEMPKNPRERNFWKVLKENRKQIPKETYNYVFYIFAAAVIGEDPRLFGFDFDNPLKSAMR